MSLFSKSREKEARRQEDIARQREEVQNIGNQFLSQLVPGSQEFNELQAFVADMTLRSAEPAFAVSQLGGEVLDQQEAVRRFGQQIVTQQQQRIATGGAATPLEQRTNLSFQGLRDVAAFSPEEQALLNALRGVEGTQVPGAAGGTQDIFSQVIGRARDPNAAFTSTLAPQLQLAQDQVKARAAQRGILGSGLELENLGRAGVELAIQEATARENFRQRQLENFQSLFNAGQGLRSREIGLEEALLNLQSGRESRLTDLLRGQTGDATTNLLSLLTRGTSQSIDDRLDAEADAAARRAALGSAIGTGLSIAAAPFTGGASLAFAPAAASLGSSLAGGGSAQGLFSQQQAVGAQGTVSPSAGLSRRSQEDREEEFIRLLRSLSPGSSSADFASSLRGGGF